MRDQDLDKVASLRMSMKHFDSMDLEEYDREDLDEGYHPYFHDTGRTTTYLVVKRMTFRDKHRGRGRRPDNIFIEVLKAEDVPLEKYRTWKSSDRVEVEELDKSELWNGLQGEEQENLIRGSERGGDEEE